ncbi:MAG: cobalamin-dependent protein [Magnetococcales bacterium]|nr:cobalamin-dependent protein [Magnetococcales bacterium]
MANSVKHGLDLLLINPGGKEKVYQNLSNTLMAKEPPIWCGMIATFIRNHGFSVAILDANVLDMPVIEVARQVETMRPLLTVVVVYGQNPSASTMVMPAAIALSQEIKANLPDFSLLLLGGHVAALPQQSLQESGADFVCDGEGPYTVLDLLHTLQASLRPSLSKVRGLVYRHEGVTLRNRSAPLVTDLDGEMGGMAMDLLPMDRYRAHNWHCFDHLDQRQPYGSIYTSLGCPFHCHFCCIQAPFKPGQKEMGLSDKANTYRTWSAESVVRQIDILVQQYGVKNIKFADELFVIKKSHVEAICNLLLQRKYDLNIWAYARVDRGSQELFDKMKQVGINWVCLGIESGSKRVRDDVAKGFQEDDLVQAMDSIRNKAGIYVLGNYLFGLPEDDHASMQETLDLAMELNCEFANFYCAMSYPGSQLYDRAHKMGLRLPESWSGYSQHAFDTLPLPTDHISGVEVLRFRDQAFTTYFTSDRYLAMIESTFGPTVRQHVLEMASQPLPRQYLQEEDHGIPG